MVKHSNREPLLGSRLSLTMSTAIANTEEGPQWPIFLARNRHLAPEGYKLNSAEANAAVVPREMFIPGVFIEWSPIRDDDDSEWE